MRHFHMLWNVSRRDKYFTGSRKMLFLIGCNGSIRVENSIYPECYLLPLYPEYEGTMILRNFSNYLPVVQCNIKEEFNFQQHRNVHFKYLNL
jgi:hypothetical protein